MRKTIVTCDMCDRDRKDMEHDFHISLKGITGTSGGILLPEQFHEKDFCSSDCFWDWVEKYNPRKQAAT